MSLLCFVVGSWDLSLFVLLSLWCLFDASETFSLDSTSHTSVTSSHNAIIKNDTTVHVRYIELIASFCIKISLYYIFWLPCNRFCNRKAKRQKTIQEVELIQVTVSDDGWPRFALACINQATGPPSWSPPSKRPCTTENEAKEDSALEFAATKVFVLIFADRTK